jgi:hypothetical protein
MFHDPQRIYGENAAGNSGSGGWGTLRSPDQILTRFVEYELDDPWPHNGHLTQVLWRVSNCDCDHFRCCFFLSKFD